MNKILYTAIIDGYDTLKNPAVVTEGWRYLCFTNDETLTSDIWEIIILKDCDKKTSRKVKILADFEYDICIWVDANIEIHCDLNDFVDKFCPNSDFTVLAHPDRRCIYEEGKACIILKKDDPKMIKSQMEQYKCMNYPENNGMVGTGLMVRKNNENYESFFRFWWAWVKDWSKRDQLSFNYCAHVLFTEYNTIPFEVLNTHFKLTAHKRKIE